MDDTLGRIEVGPRLDHIERRLQCVGTWRALCRLVETARQPPLEAFAADWPGFAMAVDVDVGEGGAVGRVEQFGGLREVNQDIGLFPSAPALAHISTFLGDRLIERRHPANLLQLSTKRLKRGAVVPPERREPLLNLWRERGARIGGAFLDKSFERIGNILRRADGLDDWVYGLVDCDVVVHCAPSLIRGARPNNMSLKSIP